MLLAESSIRALEGVDANHCCATLQSASGREDLFALKTFLAWCLSIVHLALGGFKSYREQPYSYYLLVQVCNMGEVAGLVLGAAGLAACFDSCLSAFNYIDSATKYGKDYQKAALKISLLQLRLSRWKESVCFIEDEAIGTQLAGQVATREQTIQVEELLGEIQHAFEDAQNASKRYRLKEATTKPDTEQLTMDELTARARNMAIRRQKHTSIRQKARWALHDRKKMDRLVEDLGSYVTSLVELFPSIATTQLRLATKDASDLVPSSDLINLKDGRTAPPGAIVREASFDTDTTLCEAVQRNIEVARTGHSYENIEIGDEVRAKFGNEIATGHMVNGPGHSYKNIKATGKAIVQYGDSYGMKSIFDT